MALLPVSFGKAFGISSSLLHSPKDPLCHGNCLCVPSQSKQFFSRIEARGNARIENPKIRNRRMERKYNGSARKPRLSVFCSNKQLYAMLVDDRNKKTLFYASTLQKSIRNNASCTTAEAARRVGEELIEACKDLNISEISSYDRNGFARGERMAAFEIPIAEHGFLLR